MYAAMALAPLANVVLRPFLSNDVLDYWPAHPLRTLGPGAVARVKDGVKGHVLRPTTGNKNFSV